MNATTATLPHGRRIDLLTPPEAIFIVDPEGVSIYDFRQSINCRTVTGIASLKLQSGGSAHDVAQTPPLH